MSDWYCRFCSHYTASVRCTCDDPLDPVYRAPKKKRKPRLLDKSYYIGGERNSCYVGHEVHSNLIYVGAPHYEQHAQIHLSLKEAKWIAKTLEKAIARAEKLKSYDGR